MTNDKRKVGRPATGQNTKVVRVPKNFSVLQALTLYYDWLPVIDRYTAIAKENPNSVRNEKLIKMLEELGEW